MISLVNVVDKSMIEKVIEQSRCSARGRAVTVLHPPEKRGLRVLVNAIQPGSYVQPHLHDSDEAFATLTGTLDVIFFDYCGKIIERYRLDNKGAKFVDVPIKVYHTIISRETDSSILDLSIGPYNPDEFKEFASWAPVEPKEGMVAYGTDIIDFIRRIY